MQGLDRIFSKPSQLNVLRVLYRADEALTGREVERRSGLSNRATMLALDHLYEISVIDRESTSTSYLFRVNRNNYFVAKALKQSFEAEELFWQDFGRTVRKTVHPKPIAAVATGPLARDEHLDDGRVDIVMVFSSGRSRLRAFPSLETLAEKVWHRYAIAIESNLLDLNTMDRSENDALWRRVEREGILLFGTLP
ncbi:MAG: hypothetical protein ACI9TH_002932 [Kiritimatiellia bacterium]|jgi:hypothetical protein